MENSRHNKGHANQRSYYRILHVQHDAPVQIIKSSYRTLMQKLKQHPDLGGDTLKAALINEAYAVVSDATKRATYDLTRKQTYNRSTDATQEKTAEPQSTKEDSPLAASKTCRSVHTYEQIISGNCVFCRTLFTSHSAKEDAICSVCASPLFMTGPTRCASALKRSVERMPREQPATILTHWPQQVGIHVTLKDVSLSGICIRAEDPLQHGQTIKIENDQLHAVARVVNCRQEPESSATLYSIGVEFITLSLHLREGNFFSATA